MLDMPKKRQALDPNVLTKFAFFASFPTDQLEEIAENAQFVALKKGAVVFRQGEHSDMMYLVLNGRVRVEREDVQGETIYIREFGRHEVFGELAMLSLEPRQATVTAVEDSEFLLINRAMMLDIIRKSEAEEILEVFSVLSDQIRAANDQDFQDLLARRTLSAQMEVEKQRALTQMVAGVAHEINTPLGIINTAVSIMARELASPKEMTAQRAADIAESLELMRRNVERAHRLVQDFKKLSVSQLIDEKEEFDLAEAVEETISLIMLSLKQNRIQVRFKNKLPQGQSLWHGYRGFLSQVLINLLTNVERYAYEKDQPGTADVLLEMADAEHFRLTVRDYGKGISKENQKMVFEPFFTTGRSIGGTGLGLAIVHNLVTNALKGEIKLKSEEGRGAEFTMTFPKDIKT